MPAILVHLPIVSVNTPIIDLLNTDTADKQIVSAQLNAVLKADLISSAQSMQLTVLVNLLQTLPAVDLAAAQNLSLQAFVQRYAVFPMDPAGLNAANAAVAALSSTTTIGALLGLNRTASDNPIFGGIVAQANFAALLNSSPALSNAQLQADFLNTYTAFQGTTQDFWAQLAQDDKFKAVVSELQEIAQFGTLTLDNAQLISALRATKPTSLRDLTKVVDAKTLSELITAQKIPVPAEVSGSSPAEQLTNYVNGITALLEAAFPTDYVARGLAGSTNPTDQLVARVLSNAPDIDLQSTNIDAYLKQNSTKAFQNVPADQVQAVTKQLKSAQRVFRISPDAPTVATLLNAKCDSAAKIAAIPRTAFVQRFSSVLGGDSKALGVYFAASHINAQTLNVYRTVQTGLKEINPRAIGNADTTFTQKIQQQLPNWEGLFGSTSYCACSECSSVYGPAAYFVDLLQFLGNSKPNSSGFTPLDVLIGGTQNGHSVSGRRPDLPYVKLNCTNANTPLPYVDLVNEILESYIALNGKLDSSTAHDTPSDATPDELSVNPEYTVVAAYTALAQATYPLTLPYDRFLDVVRTYLTFLRGDRRQVLELFQTQQAPVDVAAIMAAETLGLSQTDFELIANWNFLTGTTATLPSLSSLYAGNAPVTTPWETWISKVPTFLSQTGIVFEDLVNLVSTHFINPTKAITLQGTSDCDLQHMTITALDDVTLVKILPFLRLWRTLGWSMSDLDKALQVFAPSGVNRGCLLALAGLKQLTAQLKLGVPQLLALWSNLDTDGSASLYFTLFQNKAVLNPPDPAFQLPGGEIPPGSFITDETPAILAALRISTDDLNAIRAATGLVDTGTKTPLTLTNVTQLYRYTVFARALGLSIADLLSLIELTGVNPFQLASTDPALEPTVRFVEGARAVRNSAFSVSDLNFIYRAEFDPAEGVGPLEANLESIALSLKQGLGKIAAANAFVPDPAGKLLRQKLGSISGGTNLTDAMDLIAGTAAYQTSLSVLPAIILPAGVTYDNTDQLLRCDGPMPDSEKADLLALSSDTAYQQAVSSLFQQPRDILQVTLGFLNLSDAITKLINVPSPDVADRYSYVLRSLLIHLTDSQSRVLVQQALSQGLGIDSATTALLITASPSLASSALVPSQRDKNQPAVIDLLDLRDGGLLAIDYSDLNLTTVAGERIADAPAANGVSNPGGASWRGKLLPQFSESYTFSLFSNDGVRLWINDQLVIDSWMAQSENEHVSTPMALNAGQMYAIRLDYFNVSAQPVLMLKWSGKATSSNTKVAVPQSALLPESAFGTLQRLFPIGLLLSKFRMKADEVAYLSSHPGDFAGVDPDNSANTVAFDLAALPVDRSNAATVDAKAPAFFNQWTRLNDLFALRNSLPQGNIGLFDVFRAASSSTNPAQLSSGTVSGVIGATGWDENEFATLSGTAVDGAVTVGFGLSDADFVNGNGRSGTGLIWLKRCMDLTERLGIPALQLFRFANNAPSSSQADDVKNTVKAKYDDATWIKVGKPLNDKIRDNSKNALIAYVLNMPVILTAGIADADQLYEHFLIDVQMSPCMQTSRIVQDTAAIQLFVQRCLLALEQQDVSPDAHVSPDAIDAGQWEWRKNYRVWEANREVFLYPENWIDPTLRDDRTPFFQDLQAELQQGEITADLVENAFQNYLTKVLEVSRLEICGFYCENDAETGRNVFHVFGRTFASPHVYYYRRRDNTTMIWSAWERVDADIQGDHLVPVIWNRRLHLFWPLFKEQTTPSSATKGTIHMPTGDVDASSSLPLKSLQVQLAWSEYRNGAWTKKQVTKESLTPYGFSDYVGDFDPGVLFFQAAPIGDGLTVTVYCWARFQDGSPVPDRGRGFKNKNPFALFNVGQIMFTACSTNPTIQGNDALVDLNMQAVPKPFDTSFRYMDVEQIFEVGELILATLVRSGDYLTSSGVLPYYTLAPFPLFGLTQTGGVLSYPQQFLPNVDTNVAPPFFYADASRTYLATQLPPSLVTPLRDPGYAVFPLSPAELTPATPPLSAISQLPVFADTALPEPVPIPVPVPASPHTLAMSGPEVAPPATDVLTSGPLVPWHSILTTLQSVTFSIHEHPHICDFVKALNGEGIPGLLSLGNQRLDVTDTGTASVFYTIYKPTSNVALPYPSQKVDFSAGGAYSIYNWEIFFHIPFLLATQLSRNQQFEDAEKWFRYIFNPANNSTDQIPTRYWNVLPFYENTETERIEDLLAALDYTGADPTLLAEKAEFSQEIAAWEQNPFDPDLIARMRTVAYQKAVLMKYIDHHLAWGDSLYRQFTRESVNEATLHYVLCQDLLGDKPTIIPQPGAIADQTYAFLRPSLDQFSDALVQIENLFPFSTDGSSSNSGDSGGSSATTVAMAPYFCVPPNATLLTYWDTVAQRLYQIRHCMNIAGQVQELPLFAPPINPGLLIQALAMGMDLTSALSDISAATPYYRFAYMLPKALELCAEVRSLGASLLSALEKSDAEKLSLLRATQETALLRAVRNVKQQQLNEANSNLDALNDSLAVTQNRQQYYQTLLSAGLNASEKAQLDDISHALAFQKLAEPAKFLASAFALVPDIETGMAGIGGTSLATVKHGGSFEAEAALAIAGHFETFASINSTLATLHGLGGGWDRRKQEWQFQLQTATLELKQINDQRQAATARVAAAQADLDNQDLQISQSSDVASFLRTKFTNQELFDWMAGQISSVYFQCYQMAYDLAKRAEACFVFERMPDLSTYSSFIQFGYWDSLKKGLLSGERLYQDLKRLEIAYMEQNQREYEITKSLSLLLLDPMALINLKETGQCTVQFPEALFDMDYPGHYLRRIMDLSLIFPCVVGPFTSLNCTVTLASNKIRIDNTASANDYTNDVHFVTNLAATQSIALSSGQNDSGMFSVNLKDERYLPFEGAGVISTWQLSMPKDTNSFDFETITDVIFNLRYTARDGGATLRSAARATAVLPPGSAPGASVSGLIALPAQQTLTRLFSLRHEFPSQWNAFLHPPDSAPDQTMTINLAQERFPFQYRGKKIQIYEVDVFLKFRDIYDPTKYTADGTPLGDYVSKTDGALVLNVTSPGGVSKRLELVSNKQVLASVPFGSVPQPPPTVPPSPPALGPLGVWTVVAKGTDIANIATSLKTQVNTVTDLYRLTVGVIEDIFVLCRFDAG